MKKIMILAAFAAALSLASCQKDELQGTSDSHLFTAGISTTGDRTTIASDGKVAWEKDTDVITVKDGQSNSAVYKISEIDGETGIASFVFESGAALGAGPYTATYGTAPVAAQTYSATAGNGNGTSLKNAGSSGLYWSSSPSTATGAYYLLFNSSSVYPQYTNLRYYGRSVRPVSD